MPLRLLGAQIAAPTGTGTASTVSSARVVLVQNVGSTSRLVTLEQSDGTDIGTFNINCRYIIIIYTRLMIWNLTFVF